MLKAFEVFANEIATCNPRFAIAAAKSPRQLLDANLPPDFKVPPGLKIPPGLKLPPGMTLPPTR